MSFPSESRPSHEWSLLDNLRQQLGRSKKQIPDSEIHIKKSRKRNDLERRKNYCRKIEFELLLFLADHLSILAEYQFEDDQHSQGAIHETLSKLPALCRFLNDCASIPYRPTSPNGVYPALHDIVTSLESIPESRELEVFSLSKSKTRESTVLFVLPSKKCVKDKTDWSECLKTLNNRVGGLKTLPPLINKYSDISPNSTPIWPNPEIPRSCAEFPHLISATLHAVFSGFSSCRNSEMNHGVLIAIPHLETDPCREIDLFISDCSRQENDEWQEATVQIVEEDSDSENPNGGAILLLCHDVRLSSQSVLGLTFELPYHMGLTSFTQCAFRKPSGTRPDRKRSPPTPKESLKCMIKRRQFGRCHEDTFGMGFVTFADRRKLAGKLILGMMVSLDQYHTLEAWNSSKTYITRLGDDDLDVSCSAAQTTEELHSLLPTYEDSNFITPFRSIVGFAELLLQICGGPELDSLDVASDITLAMKEVRNSVNCAISNLAGDLELFHICQAAKACLDFNITYGDKLLTAGKISSSVEGRVELAKMVFAKHVYQTYMENAYPSDDGVFSKPRGLVACPLYDSYSSDEKSHKAAYAEEFFELFDDFRNEYKKFLPGIYPAVRVAIIDTGYDKKHARLRSIQPENCKTWTAGKGSADDCGHGTYCAYYLRRIAPKAEVHVLKVFNNETFGLQEAQNIPKAIRYAVEQKFDIISMSFGLPDVLYGDDKDEWTSIIASTTLAIEFAAKNNVLMFAAASNKGRNGPRTFPANSRHVICVHATDGKGYEGEINPLPEPWDDNFATLGISMPSPRFQKQGEVYNSGTSFATPVAAGIAAVILDMANSEDLIDQDIRHGLKNMGGMREMFKLMSKDGTGYRYVAPWLLWEKGWVSKKKDIQTIHGAIWKALKNFDRS